jgi:hypothetical protein
LTAHRFLLGASPLRGDRAIRSNLVARQAGNKYFRFYPLRIGYGSTNSNTGRYPIRQTALNDFPTVKHIKRYIVK